MAAFAKADRMRKRRRVWPAPKPNRPAHQHPSERLNSTRSSDGPPPQLVPDSVGHVVRQAITQLVREHQDLPAMMCFVREHISEHDGIGRPRRRPTPALKLPDPPCGVAGQSVRQHAQALRPTFLVRGGGLLHRAAVGVEWCGALQVRRRILEPPASAIVQVREDRGDGAAVALGTG